MKTYLFIACMLFGVAAKAQVSNTIIGVGSTLFIGSVTYYMVGQPKTPTIHNQVSWYQYNDKLNTYQNLRTVAVVTSSAVLLTGLILKTGEMRVSKNASVNASPFGAQLTLRW